MQLLVHCTRRKFVFQNITLVHIIILVARLYVDTEFDCAKGSTIYQCSISSNDENLFLAWDILVPDLYGDDIISVRYDSYSEINVSSIVATIGESLLGAYASSKEVNSTLRLINTNISATSVRCSARIGRYWINTTGMY